MRLGIGFWRRLGGIWMRFGRGLIGMGPHAEVEWEEKFGSRFSRELVRWFLDNGMSMKSARGWMGFVLFA